MPAAPRPEQPPPSVLPTSRNEMSVSYPQVLSHQTSPQPSVLHPCAYATSIRFCGAMGIFLDKEIGKDGLKREVEDDGEGAPNSLPDLEGVYEVNSHTLAHTYSAAAPPGSPWVSGTLSRRREVLTKTTVERTHGTTLRSYGRSIGLSE